MSSSLESAKVIIINKINNTSTTAGTYTVNFPISQTFKKAEIALSAAFLYYSWQNVTASNNNNTFSYIFNSITYPVNFPNGMYEVSDLNAYMQLVMQQNGHYIVNSTGVNQYYVNIAVNPIYYTITITCTPIPSSLPTGWTNPNSIFLSGNTTSLIIPDTNMKSLTGFNAGTYGGGTALFNINAQNVANVSISNVINFGCNMVNNSSFSNLVNVIYSFAPSVSFARQIVIDRPTYAWFKIVDGAYTSITINLVNELGNAVKPLDPNVMIKLIIRQQ